MNIKNLFKFVLVWVALAGVLPATAQAWTDIKVNLMNGALLTEEEISGKTLTTFGIAIGADGTVTRVESTDATANVVVEGKFHTNDHGWNNFKATTTVPAGAYKISMGTCAWGGDVKVTFGGTEVAKFNTNNGTCYHGNTEVNFISVYYVAAESGEMVVSGGNYTPYFAIEAIDESEIPNNMAVTYGLGDTGAEGILPANAEVELGSTFAIPVNRTLYVEGKTLTGWTDGTTTYALGQEVKAEGTELALTPVFTANEVSLVDRTETVSITWDFQRKNGAPVVGVQGKTMIWVAQAVVNGKTIDVKMPIDATSGKVANGSWSDWAQINGGTILTIPACKGTVVSLESYNATTTTTIADDVINQGTTTPTYTYEGTAETIDIVIGDGSYWRTVKVDLPVATPETPALTGIELTYQNIDQAKSTADGTVAAPTVYYFSNTDITLNMNSGRAITAYERTRGDVTFNSGIDFKNNTQYSIVLPEGMKAYGISFQGYSNGDNWEYLYAYGKGEATDGYAWVDPIGTGIKDNAIIIGTAKYPIDPCIETTETSTQNPGYEFAYLDFSDAPIEGEFPFYFSGNNKMNAKIVVYVEAEDEGGEEGGEEIEIPEKSVEIGTVEAVIGEGDLVDISNCRQKAGQLIDSSYDGSYVTFIVNTTKAGEYLFTSMIGTTVDGAAITLGYVDENGEYVASEKKDITNSGNWNDGPNYTWKFNLEANKVYTFKILCHTASGSGYCVNLFAMNIGMEGLITPEYTVTYGLGDVVAEGVVPTAVKVKAGQKVTIPANFTLYVEGKTLTGWTDGTNTYAIGQEFTVTGEVALTPVFTDNKVSLDDRTKEVTVKWTFRRDEGAPVVGWEGKTGLIWVTQAVVEGQTIDVKMDVSTSPGKMNNGNWEDWAQLNGGTTFTIPSCKGAVVSIEAYSAPTTTTIDGQTDYTANGNVISYTVANTANVIDIVIGDGSYYRYIQAVLPYVEKNYAGTVFENAEASAIWAFTSNATDPAITSPKGAFSMNSVSTGSFTMGTGNAKGVDYVTVMPADASDPTIMWTVKPAKGLTFTPIEVSAKVQRFGTDGGTLDVYARTGDGQEVLLESGLVPLRNNVTFETDKNKDNAKLCDHFTLDVPSSLASAEGFSLVVKIVGLGSNKTIGFSDVRIIGTINGTVADVAKYALTAVGNIAEAGKVTVYPANDKYDEGTEVALTAAENFGYDFVNWTNAAGEVISTEAKLTYTVNADEALTANFVKVNTYELAMTIEGGANDYMVSYNPVPTIVDGKQMYEEGTIVGVAAASNPILTFTNWSNGESNPSLSITMDSDKAYTAVYSAADYIVGWDFIRSGGSGRPADFASTVDNETAVLYMTNANGDVQGWLDKSKEAAGGYESFVGAAVNWKKLGEYWYEFKMNASEFTNIRVEAELMYNYNAYTTVIVEYSIDKTTWTEAGRVTMAGAKTENPVSATLGEDANNQAMVYVRFRPDLDGAVDGTSAPNNDGTTISNIYVYGNMKLVDDGQDPTLLSTIPTEGATGASATGKIVLNFHEKVALQNAVATIGDKEVEGVVSGKTVTFSYMGLEYNTEYTFKLAANSVYDLTGNACKNDITIKFTTIAPPTVTPGQYDVVVTNVDEFLAALKKADGSNRFRIFLHDGTYDLGTACLTSVPGNVSLIGESMENTIIVNDPQAEGIGVSATLCTGGENIYMQDLTLKSVDYDRLRDTGASIGRCVALQENASKAVYKNVRLLSNQDTYYTRATKRTYWEGGMITGTVDYLCGGGDIFFNGVTLYNNKRGSGDCITAPATSSDWGYVFSNCTIDGAAEQDGAYSLGRPWQGSPRAVYINTTMKIIPAAGGWSDMGAVPALFAEYNSHTESGAPVDCSNRKTSFSSNDVMVSVTYNPVLTAEEAAKFTVENVLAGDDGWQPQLLTEQANTPNVTVESGILKWNASDYVFCYAICKNGKIVEFTNETSWIIPSDATDEDYFSVRAANNMGGLCVASEGLNKNGATGVAGIVAEGEVLSTEIYTIDGVQLSKPQQGINIIRTTYVNGAVTIEKKMVK